MKELFMLFFFASFLNSAGYKTYIMDNNYFRCLYPSEWRVEREAEKDKKNSIYKVVFINQSNPKITVSVKYYTPQSNKNYMDFIEKNSKSEDGKLETPGERYEKVKEIKISERKAYEINRMFKEFESVDIKSGSYWLKERIVVIPSKKGFYTVSYSSDEKNFNKNLSVFQNILKSLKMLY